MPNTPGPAAAGPAGLTVEPLARPLACRFEGDGGTVVSGVAGLENARKGDLVFLAAPKFRKLLEGSPAAAALIPAAAALRGHLSAGLDRSAGKDRRGMRHPFPCLRP